MWWKEKFLSLGNEARTKKQTRNKQTPKPTIVSLANILEIRRKATKKKVGITSATSYPALDFLFFKVLTQIPGS